MMLPIKFRFIWQSSYRGEDSLEINQSKTRIACGFLAHLAITCRLSFINFSHLNLLI
jgi:hypothetical protein